MEISQPKIILCNINYIILKPRNKSILVNIGNGRGKPLGIPSHTPTPTPQLPLPLPKGRGTLGVPRV